MNIFRKWFVELRYYVFKIILPFPKVMSKEDTLELLIKSNISLARYGDGEFHMIGQTENLGFQQVNSNLAERLKEVLLSDNPKCLVSLPIGIQSTRGFNSIGDYFWKQFVVFHYRKYIKYFNSDRIYGNANVTRPYIDFVDHSNTRKYFDRMKCLWQDKRVLIVEGEMSKLGVGNDLFDSCKMLRRIVTLPKNAYSLYDDILSACKEVVGDYDLILVSLGPTATVLAYDLCDFDIQVVDIGHIDLEYEWFLRGVTEKVAISGKHVNELSYEIQTEATDDSVYMSQIIRKVLA